CRKYPSGHCAHTTRLQFGVPPPPPPPPGGFARLRTPRPAVRNNPAISTILIFFIGLLPWATWTGNRPRSHEDRRIRKRFQDESRDALGGVAAPLASVSKNFISGVLNYPGLSFRNLVQADSALLLGTKTACIAGDPLRSGWARIDHESSIQALALLGRLAPSSSRVLREIGRAHV